MSQLSDSQANAIFDLLVDQGVSRETLQIDLLDHLCCMVEEKMDNGWDFDQSLTSSIREFGLQNLAEIQEATIYLLTLKLNKMKKATGIAGIASAVLVIAGVFFKINHWPGAGILLMLGLSITSAFVFPFMAYLDFTKAGSTVQKVGTLSGYSAAILLSTATLFKIMQWPGFIQLYYPGLILLVFVFLPLFTIKSYRTAENKIMAFARSGLILAGVAVFWGLIPSHMAPSERYRAPIQPAAGHDQQSEALEPAPQDHYVLEALATR
ncbi:MAG: hypothetical protein AAGB22_11520 [Bacteroidota bacterium]